MERLEKQILSALVNGDIEIYKLIDYQDGSLVEFFKTLKKLERASLIRLKDGRIFLTPSGWSLLKEVNILPYGDSVCDTCSGTGYKIENVFQKILEEFKKITKERPAAKEEFDQGFMSPESVLRKIIFIHERGDLDTHIFVLGDDDLISIALALTKVPKRIFVVDIDSELVNFIEHIAKTYNLPIETLVYDVRFEIPTFLKEKFDIFISDPVETIEGFKLFFSRAIETLKGRSSAGYFGITTLEASRKKWFLLQKMIHSANFVITDIRRKYTFYPEEEKNFFRFQEKLPIVKRIGTRSNFDWYKSSLIRVEAVKKPRPPLKGSFKLDKEIYRDKESWATPE